MKKPLSPLIFALALVASAALGVDTPTVVRAVDGDTLLLSDQRRVRLIGVDTPEHHPSAKLNRDAARTRRDRDTIRALGKAATAFVDELVRGRPVRLEYERSNKVKRHRDQYGRELAYVYFTPFDCGELEQWVAEASCELPAYDEGFLNALIIEAGYGNAYTIYPFQHSERFRELERDAREHQRGLWKDAGPPVL